MEIADGDCVAFLEKGALVQKLHRLAVPGTALLLRLSDSSKAAGGGKGEKQECEEGARILHLPKLVV